MRSWRTWSRRIQADTVVDGSNCPDWIDQGKRLGVMPNDVLRVAQWTTGNVAGEAVKALLKRPDLALVGVYAYSPHKVGVDVGRLCNLGRDLGIYATNNVDALLQLKP